MHRKSIMAAVIVSCALMACSVFAQEQQLAGTSWQVVSISNGYRTTRDVMADTEITAVFGRDGTMAGSAGCNSYRASVEVSGRNITVKPALVTSNVFEFPEGIMEQESLYLKALGSARYYELKDGRLELRKANGKIAAVFVPVMPENGIFLYKSGQKEVIVEAMAGNRIVMIHDGAEYPMEPHRAGNKIVYRALDGGQTTFSAVADRAFISVGGAAAQEFQLAGTRTVKAEPVKQPVIYRNGAFEAVVEERAADAIFLTVNGETHWLRLVPSASGERYTGEANKNIEFWVHGNEAVLTIKGRAYSGGSLIKEGTQPYSEPKAAERLIADDAPEAVLLGTWRVETLAGRRLLTGTSITMSFTADGRVVGNASVNNFFASWIAEGDRLVPGRVSTSRVGGEPAHMKQENLFLDTFDKTKTYEVRGGKLIITAENGAQIVASRR